MLSAVKRFPAVQGKGVAVTQFRTPLLVELVLLRGSLMMTFTAVVKMVVMQVQTRYLFSQVTRPVHWHLAVIKINCHTLYLGFLWEISDLKLKESAVKMKEKKLKYSRERFSSQNVNRASEQ